MTALDPQKAVLGTALDIPLRLGHNESVGWPPTVLQPRPAGLTVPPGAS